MGLVFLGLGVILLLGNLHMLPPQFQLSDWWPALLILIGIKTLVVMRRPNAWISAAFWIGTGVLFLACTLGYLNLSLTALILPVVLVWFGVVTLVGCGGGSARLSGNGSES